VPQFKEVSDRKLPTNISTEQVDSQRKGSVGTGTDRPFAAKQAARNHGTGLSEEKDEQFPQSSDAKEYSLAGIF
jgi:hypothetical protein